MRTTFVRIFPTSLNERAINRICEVIADEIKAAEILAASYLAHRPATFQMLASITILLFLSQSQGTDLVMRKERQQKMQQ